MFRKLFVAVPLVALALGGSTACATKTSAARDARTDRRGLLSTLTPSSLKLPPQV